VYLCDKCPFQPIVVEKAEEKVVDDERICTFIGKDFTRFIVKLLITICLIPFLLR